MNNLFFLKRVLIVHSSKSANELYFIFPVANQHKMWVSHEFGKINIKHEQLVDPNNITLPPFPFAHDIETNEICEGA